MPSFTRLSLIEELCVPNNEAAWREFADIYDALILGWLGKAGVQDADAEDIRQEVMTVVLVQIPEFKHCGFPGAFRSWLRRITANRMHRLWEKKTVRSREQSGVDLSLVAEQLHNDASRLSVAWDEEHDAFVLRRLFESLGNRFSQQNMWAVKRVVLGGEPIAKVAADLGLTEGAIRVAQHRIIGAREVAQHIIAESGWADRHG